MGKPDQDSAAAEGARRAIGDAAGSGRGGRFRDGEARSGFGGGGGSPEGDRRRRRVRPWGPIFSRSEARGGAASVARGGS